MLRAFSWFLKISKPGGDTTSLSNLLHCLFSWVKIYCLPPDNAIQKAFAWLAVAVLAGSAFPGQSCPLLFPEFYGDPVGPISAAMSCPSGWESSSVIQICYHLQSWWMSPPVWPAGHWEMLDDLSHSKTTAAHFLPGCTVQTWTQSDCSRKCWPTLAKSS